MKLSKKHEKQIEIQAKRLKNMYESPSKEVADLLKKVNESPTMPSGMTREEEVNLILQKVNELN